MAKGIPENQRFSQKDEENDVGKRGEELVDIVRKERG
jgi:hypothetical protein